MGYIYTPAFYSILNYIAHCISYSAGQDDGCISCAEFSKTFLSMGFAEREKELRQSIKKQRQADELRKTEQERKEKELAAKNSLKVNFAYTEEDTKTALEKLTEAAWRY